MREYGGDDGGERVVLAVLSYSRGNGKTIVRTLPAKLNKSLKDDAYKIYISDALMAICNNGLAEDVMRVERRFVECITPKEETTEAPMDIVNGLAVKMGIEVIQ